MEKKVHIIILWRSTTHSLTGDRLVANNSHTPLTGDRQVVNNSHTPLTGDRRRQCHLRHSLTGRRGSTTYGGCCPCGRCAAKYFPAGINQGLAAASTVRQWSFHCLGDTNTCGIRYAPSSLL